MLKAKDSCECMISSPDLLRIELGAGAAVVGGLLPQVARHVEDAHAHLLQAAAGRCHNLLLLVCPDVEVLVPAIKGADNYFSFYRDMSKRINDCSPVDDVAVVHVLALGDEFDLFEAGVLILSVVGDVDLDPPVVVVAEGVVERPAASLILVLRPVVDLMKDRVVESSALCVLSSVYPVIEY